MAALRARWYLCGEPRCYLGSTKSGKADLLQGLLDFFVRELGPAVYNQGVRDVCAAMQDKLGDLEGEVYEKERKR